MKMPFRLFLLGALAAANRLVATLHLDATVNLSPSLEKSLKAIPSVLYILLR